MPTPHAQNTISFFFILYNIISAQFLHIKYNSRCTDHINPFGCVFVLCLSMLVHLHSSLGHQMAVILVMSAS
ncbi:hypothetical protein K450DRAFT_261088 [Umbelopsis ramanniana AG]|uniref:Uncharacterized protein n=1 Tax=Umbelopsis ramanniana AG TaxID=1314678 RepID=A0AAD5H854_UMBRA|nr:uncharacterized protein K450DRAFT_261088 [Umbelopsis ramanniana AG]KAI8575595.1 hypothetical protein K450DRAFT_261088 [Umbelopsis ramanniana AG]